MVISKVDHTITIQPSNSTPRYEPKRTVTHVEQDICAKLFSATLFITEEN